jgi:DNA ligase 1
MSRKDIMLCYPFDIKRFKKWGSRAYIQPKLDGLRCRIVFNHEGTPTLYSSEGNVITSVPHINRELDGRFWDMELDGELYNHSYAFQMLCSVVKRTANIHPDHEDIEFHCFDIIDEGRQGSRLNALKQFNTLDHLKWVKTEEVESEDDIERFYDKVTLNGYEGFILRNPLGLYKRSRSTDIMKCKPHKSDLYQIVGVEEEYTIDGIPKNSLGALVLASDVTRPTQPFKVGSGFTREQRQALWTIRPLLIGKWCKIKYQELTTDRKVPRFPVFISIEEENNEQDQP